MTRRAVPGWVILGAAALQSCSAPADNAVTEAPDPLANIAQASASCPELNAQLTSHPEADARAAYAASDFRFRELLVMGVGPTTSAPGTENIAWDRLQPQCNSGMPHIIHGGTDTRPCMDFYEVAMLYIERYNRELVQLCGPTPVAKPASKH